MKPQLSLGSGDSELHFNIFPEQTADQIFEQLDAEIDWNEMTHKGGPVPRLVSIQAERTEVDGQVFFPVYRHPVDEAPDTIEFTPTVQQCRDAVHLEMFGDGFPLEFNHVLIQKYRSGKDNISEHADKTLDITRGTPIVNLSLGATRVLILKPKPDCTLPDKRVQKITLPHNSLFVLGWETNRQYTHRIKADKRNVREKRADECLYNGQRISLTFRSIATFINHHGILCGQGAPENQDTKYDYEQLINAFSLENKSAQFDWDQSYGGGFTSTGNGIFNSYP
jgi:alkylated DNA repair dioxygenase AlkB